MMGCMHYAHKEYIQTYNVKVYNISNILVILSVTMNSNEMKKHWMGRGLNDQMWAVTIHGCHADTNCAC